MPSECATPAIAGVLPDILVERLAVVFCGINPGLEAAATGHHFAGRGNRFWRVMHLAGFTAEQIRPENDRSIHRYRCGMTTVIQRPTARAHQLSPQDFIAAGTHFEQKISRYAPRFVSFLGKAAYAALSGQQTIAWGLQPVGFAGAAAVWIPPNPSGRNRAFTLDQLVRAYRELYLAADLNRG